MFENSPCFKCKTFLVSDFLILLKKLPFHQMLGAERKHFINML